jgi:hypothetical protein
VGVLAVQHDTFIITVVGIIDSVLVFVISYSHDMIGRSIDKDGMLILCLARQTAVNIKSLHMY